jgi:serine O-acetyltransferase
MKQDQDKLLQETVSRLCDPASYSAVWHHNPHHNMMPSTQKVAELIEGLRAILFPGYYGKSDLTPGNMPYIIGAQLDTVCDLLREQIKCGLCFACGPEGTSELRCRDCTTSAEEHTQIFIARLPEIRRLLTTDVKAAYEGDPAAKSPGETIFCYPSITAITHHRIAHELYRQGVPILPRMISELAHSRTGIDLHPGAAIGEEFFIDHGTGTVIGETCIIGKGCRLYQGVTLGAISFPKDSAGALVKGVARHPIVEDGVTIYANATVLGRITLGAGSVIGANVWLTSTVPPGSKIMASKG